MDIFSAFKLLVRIMIFCSDDSVFNEMAANNGENPEICFSSYLLVPDIALWRNFIPGFASGTGDGLQVIHAGFSLTHSSFITDS